MLKVVVDPNSFFKERDDISMVVAVSIVALSAFLGVVMVYANMDLIVDEMMKRLHNVPPEKAEMFFEAMKVNLIVSPLVGSFLGWVIMAGLIHAVSSLLGGEGDFSKTLKLTAFGYVPSIVLFPVNFAIVSMTHKFASTPVMIVGAASTIWQFIILTFGVKNWRRLDTAKAAVSVAVPLVALAGIGIAGRLLRLK